MQKEKLHGYVVKLAEHIKLRLEYFGGIIFDINSGNILELDPEAFALILEIKKLNSVDLSNLLYDTIFYGKNIIPKRSIAILLNQLISMEILEESKKDYGFNKISHIDELTLPKNKYISAPETVHLAVTFKCNNACQDCYIDGNKRQSYYELDTYNMLKIIDKISRNNIFQLAIGGGEPFLRDDLLNIIKHASNKGLITHITTGKYEIEDKFMPIFEYIKVLQIGIHIDDILENNLKELNKLQRLVNKAHDAHVIAGANIIMTKTLLNNFYDIINPLIDIGFKRFTFLRYKPHENYKRWMKENPSIYELETISDKLSNIQKNHPEIKIRIDCASSFLERDIHPKIASFRGLQGCSAGSRIISIAPDGFVYPCSQLVNKDFKAGNLSTDEFIDIWNSDVLNKYRFYKESSSFKDSPCGDCLAKEFCGGCHVLNDFSCKKK